MYVLDLARGGFRIRSHPGERARLFGVVHVRRSAAAVTLSHLVFEGDGTMNAIKVYAPDTVLEDSVVTTGGRGWSCLMLGSNSGAGAAERTIVRRNRFHNCGSTANESQDHAIYAQHLLDGRITGNVFWNSAGYAIQLYPNAHRTLFAHNVVDGDAPSTRGGVVVAGEGDHASSDNVLEQNVIAYAASYNITYHWGGAAGSRNVARRNCLWKGRRGDVLADEGLAAVDNVVANPGFRDRGRRDYRLHPRSRCLAVVAYDAAARLRR